VILDRSHRGWAAATALLLLLSSLSYALYVRATPGGPSGGTAEGIAFGAAASACMLFAALLGVRKRRPHYRLGRISGWLKGHLWLGALSLPLVLFHGGFAMGGPLTRTLMICFLLVFVTGIFGLLLQQFLPRYMTKNVVQETVYEQIDHVREQLLAECVAIAKGGAGAATHAKSAGAIQGRVVTSRAAGAPEGERSEERAPLLRFLDERIRPYFRSDGARREALAEPHRRATLFRELVRMLPPTLHPCCADLEALCGQREQLEMQRRLHLWLHGWLLVHVPLSWTVIALGILHAVLSLSY